MLAHSKVTFWSSNIVKFKGYNGNINIDRLPEKVLSILKTNLNFDESVRPIGQRIVNKIDTLYDDYDAMLDSSCLFTKIFYVIKSLFKGVSKTRWCWKDCDGTMDKNVSYFGYHHVFKVYTKKQFQQVYNLSPSFKNSRDTSMWEFRCYQKNEGPLLLSQDNR